MQVNSRQPTRQTRQQATSMHPKLPLSMASMAMLTAERQTPQLASMVNSNLILRQIS